MLECIAVQLIVPVTLNHVVLTSQVYNIFKAIYVLHINIKDLIVICIAQLFSFHTVSSEIEFHMNDTSYAHQNYTASCTIRANPRMNLYMFTQLRGCDFQYKTSQIDEYTTKATITIYNITSECSKITCSTNLFQRSKTVGKEINYCQSSNSLTVNLTFSTIATT